MREIMIIAKKEFARFFSNKATAFTALFLPGLLMAGMYTAMGNMEGMNAHDDNETYTIAVSHLPTSIETIAKDSPLSLVEADGNLPDKKSMRQAIGDEKYDAYAVFPDSFDETIAGIASGQAHNEPLPVVEIYYDNSVEKSYYAYESLSALLDGYESSLANVFDVNSGEQQYDLADDDSVLAKILGSVLPMLILIMLVASIGAISAESIAGEKERGTIATLLATPIRRSSIVWGKLITIASVGVVSTIFTLVGIIVGLTNMADKDINFSLYSAHDYALLAGVLIPFSLAISVLMIFFPHSPRIYAAHKCISLLLISLSSP